MASKDTKTKKNKSKNKKSLFMCFKSVNMDDSLIKPRRRKDKKTDQVVTNFAVGEKEEDVVLPVTILSSAFAAADDGGKSRRRTNGMDRWQALRAALNETSLMRKIIGRRKANNRDNLSRSNSKLKEEEASGKISNSQSTDQTDSNASSSFGCSSAFTSSSSLSSSSSSRTDHTSDSSSHEIHPPISSLPLNGAEVTNQKQYGVEDRKRKVYYGSNTSKCMFLISLLVLIMSGKFFAILYTSIWFYLMPPSRRRPCNEGDPCGE